MYRTDSGFSGREFSLVGVRYATAERPWACSFGKNLKFSLNRARKREINFKLILTLRGSWLECIPILFWIHRFYPYRPTDSFLQVSYRKSQNSSHSVNFRHSTDTIDAEKFMHACNRKARSTPATKSNVASTLLLVWYGIVGFNVPLDTL